MSDKHTQGRLVAKDGSQLILNSENDGRWLADARTVHRDIEEDRANARRLAACWNAFEGVSTADVELWAEPGTGGVKAVIAKNDQQRTEFAAASALLVEVLKECDKAMEEMVADGMSRDEINEEDEVIERIRAFLKGGA